MPDAEFHPLLNTMIRGWDTSRVRSLVSDVAATKRPRPLLLHAAQQRYRSTANLPAGSRPGSQADSLPVDGSDQLGFRQAPGLPRDPSVTTPKWQSGEAQRV